MAQASRLAPVSSKSKGADLSLLYTQGRFGNILYTEIPLLKQLGELTHDRPWLFVCTTFRSGSTWLGSMLAIQGFRGAQREWFARYQLGDTGLKPVQQAIDASRGTWAATKLMPGHRKAAARALGISDTPQAFEDAFGQIRRVYLWREDTIAQAVSLWRATQSGIWHGSDRAKGPERPEYDFQGILKQWQAIQQWNADWAEFLDPVTHYAVSYEMLLSNPASEIARIMG